MLSPLNSPIPTAETEWPVAELESVGKCPLCGGTSRDVWRSGLTDLLFRSSQNRWTLWRCAGCAGAYLDPRPDGRSIGRAYASYYTHASEFGRHFVVPGDEPRMALKRAVHASYYRRRFGHRLMPEFPGGWAFIAFSARRRARAEQYIRHLPAAPSGARLLDVGSGDGSFLRVARALGYRAEGIETDEAATAVAVSGGFSVRLGAIDTLLFEPNAIDQVTLNHVIEHLHDPGSSLRRLFTTIRPGGRIWLQTPNIDGLGASYFESFWRGLEPPRHLVLFNEVSLRRALQAAGFVDMQTLPPPPDASFYIAQSEALREGENPYATLKQNQRRHAKQLGKVWNRIALETLALAESITMVAFKPR